MTGHTDLFPMGPFGGKPLKEQVTPHKMSVIVLIQEYCSMKKADMSTSPRIGLKDGSYADQSINEGNKPKDVKFTEKEKRNFMVTILQLLQTSNLSLRDLCMKVKDKMKPELYTSFCSRLEEFIDEGVGAIKYYFQNITFLLMPDNQDQPVITKSSVLGLFIRRMILAFEKLTFSQMTDLYSKFESYFNASNMQAEYEESQNFGGSLTDSAMSLSGVRFSRGRSLDPFQLTSEKKFSEESAGFSSQRHAEYFILQQVFMLQHNESEALPPAELQDKITDMLIANPGMAEAHFLSFLNNLRVKEYCTALHNLIHYFDRKTSLKDMSHQGQGSKVKDETVPHRYAALNLASFHYRFGNSEEALASLTDAVYMAQEVNDLVCLQHLLGWLHRLGQQGTARTENLLERAVAKSSELILPNLTSISIQAFSRHNAFATAKPSQVFEYLQRSDILNCQHSQSGFMCTSYANKAALWKMYGKRECMSMMSQLILNLDTAEGGVYYNGESVCIALCNIARLHADGGQYGLAIDLINNAKKRFPKNSQHSQIWMRTEQEILFDRTILNKKLGVAETAILNMQALDKTESELRSAILNKEKGDVNTALKQLHCLIDQCGKTDRANHSPDFICRVLLVLGEVYSQTGNSTNALSYVLECITEAKKHHLEYLAALAAMQLAYIQFQMQLPEQGLSLLIEHMLYILSHGSVYDQGRLLYCYVKCQVAIATKKGGLEKTKTLQNSVAILHNVIELFQSVEAFLRVKDVTYYLARLYHELGNTEQRNKCAHQFRQLESQYPTLCKLSVNVL